MKHPGIPSRGAWALLAVPTMVGLIMVLLGPLLATAEPGNPSTPVASHSSIAFTLKEKDLLPENLAYDPKTGHFLVGSTRKGKILGVVPDSREWDFVPPRGHGLWMVIGMKADPARRVLWVASSDGDNLIGHHSGNGSPAGLFKFDLDSGEFIASYLLNDPGVTHFLNDLVVAPDGDIYVTHMFDVGQVWRLDTKTGVFAPFYPGDAAFHDPNGIVITPDGQRLYVADDLGISAIDILNRTRKPLQVPKGIGLGGVDGLYLYGHDLIAIQPDLKRVSRCRLDDSGLAVTGCETLEQNHPLFAHPTTGVIVDGVFYYIANSQFDSVGPDGSLPPLDQLHEPVILKIKL